MTPRKIAILKDAVRNRYIEYVNSNEMNELLEKGYLYDNGAGICEITESGLDILIEAREF